MCEGLADVDYTLWKTGEATLLQGLAIFKPLRAKLSINLLNVPELGGGYSYDATAERDANTE